MVSLSKFLNAQKMYDAEQPPEYWEEGEEEEREEEEDFEIDEPEYDEDWLECEALNRAGL